MLLPEGACLLNISFKNLIVPGRTRMSMLETAIAKIVETAKPDRVILFGSRARGDAQDDSDFDFLVIEPHVEDRAKEMVRIRRALRPLRIPVDILVYSRDDVVRWGDQPGSALYFALREGKIVYG